MRHLENFGFAPVQSSAHICGHRRGLDGGVPPRGGPQKYQLIPCGNSRKHDSIYIPMPEAL
jgi:hypothetical protein